MRGGFGVIKTFRRKLSCLTVPNFSQWNPFVLCFRKLPLAKEIKNEKGVIKIFHRQKICLTVPERFLREHFCAAFEKISGSEKLYG